MAHRHSSAVLAAVSCVGEVLGWHCGSEPVMLDVTLGRAGKAQDPGAAHGQGCE